MITEFEITSEKRPRDQRVNYSEPSKIITKSTKRRYTIGGNKSIKRQSTYIIQRSPYYLCAHSTTTRYIIFILFISLVITIGVLTVYFTSIKKDIKCQLIFERTMKSSIVKDSNPYFVAIGDLNNDNKMDFVTVNSGTHTIGIFMAQDNETFAEQLTYSTGLDSQPYSIVISDFNNDTYFDIAVSNYGINSIGIFIGYGNGTFNDQILISLQASRPLFLSVGDFNKDNLMDLVVVNYGTNNIGILIGYGNGSFQNQITYSTGYDSIPYSLAVADFDKDNKLDIAVANYGTDNIKIFLGYNNGTFANQLIYTTTHNSNPSSIGTGDFNNDNQLDIAVTNNGTGNIGIFIGNANGTFLPQTTIELDFHPKYLTIGYISEDNFLDIVVVDPNHDRIYVLPGYGDGTFEIISIYDGISGSAPFWIATANLNNNNRTDIVVPNYGTNTILRLIDYSSLKTTRLTKYNIGTPSITNGVAVSDFNSDKILDIVSYTLNSIVILTGLNNGTFGNTKLFFIGDASNVQYITVGDLNNDNRIDIIISDLGYDCVGVFLGHGDGNFDTMTTYSTGTDSNPYWVALSDVNNDAYLDIISANRDADSIGIFIGKGDGTFDDMVSYSTGSGSFPTSIGVYDINNDNHLDILITLWYGNIVIFLGDGNATFIIWKIYSLGSELGIFSVALADFNSDGYVDIIVANAYGGVIACFGDGDGVLSSVKYYGLDSTFQPLYFIVADFDGNGKDDIIANDFGNDQVVILYGDGHGNILKKSTYSTGVGSKPYGMTLVGLNNNNKQVIAVALWGTGDIGILVQQEVADFSSETIYSTGSASKPFSVAVGDLNNDNYVDIVVTYSETDNLDIHFGPINDTFDLNMNYSFNIGSSSQYVITCDINYDNQLDIVTVSSKNNSINVIMGFTNGTFTEKMTYSTGTNSYPYAITSGDLNHDNLLDLIVANEGTDSIGIFFGFNYTSFRSREIYSNINSIGPNGIIVGDFNNDNYLDIAATFYWTDEIGIVLGYGNGSFTDITTYSTGVGTHPWGIAIGDLNNDLQQDIVVANYIAHNIGVFLGYNNGSFATIVTYSIEENSYPRSVAIGDINNDNQSDIAVANYDANSIGILFGYGNGSFSAITFYTTGDNTYPSSISFANINNDDWIDIVVANYGADNIGILLGSADGTFINQISISTGVNSKPYWITVSDFNNDNRSDIATANVNNNNVGILLGYGNGSFIPLVIYSTGDGSLPRCIKVGDFNNDNILDIAVANSGTNSILILFGFGDGSFLLGAPYFIDVSSQPYGLVIGDFNNDTHIDVALANTGASNIEVCLGYVSQPFGGMTVYSTGQGSSPHSVAVGHFNNDTWLDIVVANYGNNNVSILLGTGKGMFDAIKTYSTGDNSGPYSVAVGDINNDYKLDIVVTNSKTDNIAIFLGYGNGTFANSTTYSTGDGSRPYIVTISDFNNDNISDIAVANSGTSNILLLYGYGNGTFGNETRYPLGYGYNPYSIAVADLNQNNWMDIVIACYSTDHIETLIKRC